MEINTNIKLGNGFEINYIVIYSIEIETNNKLLIELHGFYNKDLYKKAIKKNELRKEQHKLIDKLNILQFSDNYNESKANEIHNKINKLADKINNLKEYNDYLIKTKFIEIPYKNDYNESSILEEINKRI